MEAIFDTVSTVFTVVTFVTFIGIVAWACSKRRRDAFARAANAPFALPEDDHIAERKS